MMSKKIAPILFVCLVWALNPAPAALAGPSVKELHGKALKAVKAGNNELAIKLLTKAIDLEPSNYKLYNDRGVIHRRMGKDLLALADYHESLRIHPEYTPALNNRGVLYLDARKCRAALNDFSLGFKQKGLRLKLRFNRARALFCLGKYEDAVKDMKKYVRAKPLDYAAITLLGDYLAKLKRKDEALKCYRIAGGLTKDPKFAIKLEKKVYKLERGSQKTRSIAKNQVSGKKQKTLQWGRSALIPDLGEVERKGLREARQDLDKVSERIFKQGKFFQKRGEWQKALLRFEDVYGLVKRDRKRFAKAWLLMEMGRCHEALGEYSEAYDKLNDSLRGFKRFKQKYPKALVLAELAKVNSALGRNDRARRYSRLSGRLAPDRRPSGKRSNPPRKFVRANALASLGPISVGAAPGLGIDSGARRGSPVIRRAGNSPESTKINALLKEIKKLRQKKDYEKLSNSLMELGDLYLKTGDRENAHRSLNAALAFKLKMGRKDELTKLLMKRAALRARIGQRVSALEDYVWAGISAEMAKQEENAKKSISKAEKLAKELTKQSEKLLNSLKELWSKRLKGSVPNEAPLLYRVGKIYQAAGKNIAAGLYFERSTAASLVEKAITDHGQRSSGKFKRGVKMLESLDYYKYLQVKDRKRYSKRNISRL